MKTAFLYLFLAVFGNAHMGRRFSIYIRELSLSIKSSFNSAAIFPNIFHKVPGVTVNNALYTICSFVI